MLKRNRSRLTKGGWPDIDSGSDSEDPDLMRALEEPWAGKIRGELLMEHGIPSGKHTKSY